MSKRRNDRYYRPEDDINDLAGCLGWLMFGAIAGTIAAIFQSKQVPPEDKLQALDKQTYWDQPLVPIACPTCKALNEPNQTFCFSCGENFVKEVPQASPGPTKPDWAVMTPGEMFFFIIFLFFIASLIYAVLTGSVWN